MKKIQKIIFFFFLMLFCGRIVEAKDTIMSCQYHKDFDEYSQTPAVDVKCEIYNNDTHMCYVTDQSKGNNNKEQILNWDTSVAISWTSLSYFKNANQCPEYLLIKLKGAYELHAAKDFQDANTINKYLTDNTGIARYHLKFIGSTVNESTYCDQAIENVESFIYMNTKYIEDFKQGICKNLKSNSVNLDYCKGLLENHKNYIVTWNASIKEYINKGCLNENDDIVKEYRAGIKETEKFIEQKEDRIEDEKKGETGYDLDSGLVTENLKCDNIFSGTFGKYLKQIMDIIKFLVPIVIIGLSIIDFIKAMATQNQDEIKKAANKMLKRCIIGIVIFVLPTVLELLLKQAGIEFGICSLG